MLLHLPTSFPCLTYLPDTKATMDLSVDCAILLRHNDQTLRLKECADSLYDDACECIQHIIA